MMRGKQVLSWFKMLSSKERNHIRPKKSPITSNLPPTSFAIYRHQDSTTTTVEKTGITKDKDSTTLKKSTFFAHSTKKRKSFPKLKKLIFDA